MIICYFFSCKIIITVYVTRSIIFKSILIYIKIMI